MKKIGVVLSGCGVYDGSEIHEAVFTLLAIDRQGCEAICMAPDVDLSVINHLTSAETGEKRNVLVESARIARGRIRDVKDVKLASLMPLFSRAVLAPQRTSVTSLSRVLPLRLILKLPAC